MVMELIPMVDLRFLSQSELATLALASPNSYDLRRSDNVVVPKIDRSVFNESAGSRKQTYSRIRLDPPKSDCPSPSSSLPRRRGRPRSIPQRQTPTAASAASAGCAKPASDDSSNDPDRRENLLIASFLRQLFSREDPSLQTLVADKAVSAVSVDKKKDNWSNILAAAEEAQKALVLSDDGDRETLNSKGATVDLVALGQMEDPFGAELRSRTAGLRSEDQLLEFLSGVDGQWGSRRKRRKFVEASLFGDVLPTGWKLLLGLKRKEGIAWLDCRRYVSPNGYQFVSCKEVSSYISSLQGVIPPVCERTDNATPLSGKGTHDSNAGQIHQSAISNGSSSFSSPTPVSYVSGNQDKQPEGTSYYDATPISYIPQDSEKQPLLFPHRRSAKRRKHGKTIVDGVILKDGKYICQFCHKAFSERHRYNGHIGAHVRYQGLSAEIMMDESSARKIADHSSWAVVPYISPDNGGSNVKVDVNHTTQCVNLLNYPPDIGGRTQVSISKSSVGGHLEGIIEELVTEEIKHNECIDNTFLSTSDLNAVPQDCFPGETEKPSPNKSFDGEISDKKSFEEAKPIVSSDATPLFSSNSHIVISRTTDAASLSSGLSMSPVHTHNDEALDKFNNKTNSTPSPSKPEDALAPCMENMDDAACNVDSFNSLHAGKSVDGISLAASDADNIACTYKDRCLSSSPSKADVLESSQNVVCTSDYMDEDSNSCFDLSLSLMEMDVKAKDKHDDVFNQPSGNHSSNGCEAYSEDISTHAVEEHDEKPASKEGGHTSECFHQLFDKDTILVSSMHDTLKNNSIMGSFSHVNTQIIGPTTDCPFDTDINESLLQEIDKPVNELEFFFGRSSSGHEGNAADEMIADDAENEAIHISLSNSSWMQATNALPVLDTLPGQCGGELGELSRKSDNLQPFDELRLGTIEPSDFALFTGGPESRTVIAPSMTLGYASEIEDQQCSFQLGWNISLGNIENTSGFSSVCIWCSLEFRHEHNNDGPNTETLGFICPTCKAKFSGP